MQPSETKSVETEELAKAIALEIEKQDPVDVDKVIDENTRGVHGSGSNSDNKGACEDTKS